MLSTKTGQSDLQYIKHNPEWHAEDSQWKADHVAAMIRQFQLTPKRVCDVGCGAGGVLAALAKLPELSETEFVGYDVSDTAIRLSVSYKSQRVSFVQGDLLEPDNTDHFDLLLCLDVIEHVPDCIGFLEACKSKADWMICHIPLEITVSSVLRNSLHHSFCTVGHIHHFTEQTALLAMSQAGVHVIHSHYTESAMSLFFKHPSFKRAIANVPRYFISKFSEALCARLLGGYSLLTISKQPSVRSHLDATPHPSELHDSELV